MRNTEGSVVLHGHDKQLMQLLLCQLIPILHCIKQPEQIIAKEKKPDTHLSLKVGGRMDTAQSCAADHRSASSHFTIRDEYIYFASSLAWSWVVTCPGQREGRSGE